MTVFRGVVSGRAWFFMVNCGCRAGLVACGVVMIAGDSVKVRTGWWGGVAG